MKFSELVRRHVEIVSNLLPACIFSTHVYGAPGKDGQERENNTYSRPKIELVLSGGGAHVGVLKLLEELYVPVGAKYFTKNNDQP
jgi:hypothetical protein